MQIQLPNYWAMLSPKNLKLSFRQFSSFFLHILEDAIKRLSQFAIWPITSHSSSADSKTTYSVVKYAMFYSLSVSQTLRQNQ